jgi:hypothetical protein
MDFQLTIYIIFNFERIKLVVLLQSTLREAKMVCESLGLTLSISVLENFYYLYLCDSFCFVSNVTG